MSQTPFAASNTSLVGKGAEAVNLAAAPIVQMQMPAAPVVLALQAGRAAHILELAQVTTGVLRAPVKVPTVALGRMPTTPRTTDLPMDDAAPVDVDAELAVQFEAAEIAEAAELTWAAELVRENEAAELAARTSQISTDPAPGPVSKNIKAAPKAGAPKRAECRPATLGSDMRLSLTRITRRLRAQRGAADLPEGQFAILTTLSKYGPLTPGALAEHERVRPPSMTRMVNTLAELELVEKVEHPRDKRQVLVSLTESGALEVKETRRRRDAWLTQQLATLSHEDRQTLAAACQLMNRIAAL